MSDRQRACSKDECQRRRHAVAQARWLAQHPGYFRGRKTKHQAYREEVKAGARFPERRPKRAEQREQDAILAQVVPQQPLGHVWLAGREQDAILRQAVLLQALIASLPPPEELPEQDEIGARYQGWEDLGRRVLERRSG